jgi:gas vesicle protein
MSVWDDNFKNHEAHKNLASIKEKLDGFEHKFDEPKILESLDRLSHVVSYMEKSLGAIVDASLVPWSSLDNTNIQLNKLNTCLDTFFQNKDENQLTAANKHADGLLIHLKYLPKLEALPDLKDISESVSRFHQTVSGFMDELNQRKDQFKKEFTDLSKQIDEANKRIKQQDKNIENQKGRLDTAISEFQKQFSEAEDRRRVNFDNTSKTRADHFDSFNKNIDEQITNFLTDRKQQIDEAISENTQEVKKNIDELKKTADALYRDHEKEAKDTIDFLVKKREEAAKIVHVIGNIGVTGNYNTIANKERKAANILRGIALGFMIAIVIAAGLILVMAAKGDFDWKIVTLRMGTTLTFLIPAIYASKESAKHRQREILNRKMELELASIDPYLERLPDEKRIELKGSLTERFFGQPETMAELEEPIKASSLLDLIKTVLINLTKK